MEHSAIGKHSSRDQSLRLQASTRHSCSTKPLTVNCKDVAIILFHFPYFFYSPLVLVLGFFAFALTRTVKMCVHFFVAGTVEMVVDDDESP